MKKNKRKTAHIISAICMIAAVVLLVWLFRSPMFDPGKLYNNDSLIVKEEDRFHAKGFTCSPITEDGKMDFSFDRFSGSRTVHIFRIDNESDFSYSWNVNVSKGQCKVVLVSAENQDMIGIIGEGTGSGENLFRLSPGEYRIKIVGNGAEAKGQLILDSQNNQ